MRKKIFAILTGFLFSVSPVSAQTLLPSAASQAGAVTGMNQVGVVAAVRGSVQVTAPGQVGRIVGSGAPVYLGDEIKTDGQGRLQVLLLDETVFTIGPNSALVIDKFIYDPSTHAGEVKAKIVQGIFRFITGKIAHKKPANMKVELPVGTIGIRGTIVIGQTTGTTTVAALMGPGANNNAGYAGGGFYMENDVNGQTYTTDVNQPGFGAQIGGAGQAPSGAYPVGDSLIGSWNGALNPNPDNQGGDTATGGGGGSATDQAGQSTAGAGTSVTTLQDLGTETGHLNNLSDQSAQDSGDSNSQSDINTIRDGITTLEQLGTLSGGTAYWSQSGVSLGANGGKYNFYYEIDFANRTVGGSSSKVDGYVNSSGSTSTNNFIFNLAQKSFDDGIGGNATFSYSGVSNSFISVSPCSGCTANVTVNLNNRNGVIADTASHTLDVYSGGSNVASGSGTTDSRQSAGVGA